MFDWLDRMPILWVTLAALLLGPAPFHSTPHLWEKLNMLLEGTLSRPLDIFDLTLHAVPVLLLLAKLMRMALKPGAPASS